MNTDTIDLTDIDAFARGDHFAMFRWLRDNDPVHWHPLPDGGGFWALTTHRDVSAAYLDNGALLSSGGAMLGGSYRNEADTAAGRMLVSTDPPRHRMLRQRMHPGFTGELARRCGEQVSSLVDAAMDQALRDGGCDFATTVARELPAGVLMAMMDVGRDDAHRLIDMTRRMIGFRDPSYVDIEGDERLRLAEIQAEIFEYFYDLVLQRRGRPGADLVTLLANTTVNGQPLSIEDAVFNCMNAAVGGNETTSHTACAGIVALTERPDQYTLLLDHLELLDSAVNEILRWTSVNAYVKRVAARDISIGDRDIRAGDSVTLWNISANRDPEQFDAPDEFDIARSPNRHLSYGNGIHRCVGSNLAHLELTILLRRFVRDRVRFSLRGDVERTRSNFILGVNSLPLGMTRERG